jgi:hypothetical protein
MQAKSEIANRKSEICTMDLDDLRSRLDLAALIQREHAMKPAAGGRKMVQAEDGHDSLTVDIERGLWTWYSQAPGPGQKFLGGDVFSWIAYRRFGRPKVEGEEFIEVLRIACREAGIDFEVEFAGDPEAHRRAQDRRRREDTLAAYAELAARCWTPELREQARRVTGKPWLTDEVMERWGLGWAPTAGQMREAGLSFAALLDVCLVSWKDGVPEDVRRARTWEALKDAGQARIFFRYRMIIPYRHRGRVVYLAGRDAEARPAWEERDASRKILYLPTLRKDRDTEAWYGVPQPDGYGLDAIETQEARDRGVMLVEGALDAIACAERGWPAVAMLRSGASEGLAKRFAMAGAPRALLALDGTADVDQAKRARVSARLPWGTKVCRLPADKDPDDLDQAALDAVAAEAVPAIEEWTGWIGPLEGDRRKDALAELAAALRAWRRARPDAAPEMRASVCKALGFNNAEYAGWLGDAKEDFAPKAEQSEAGHACMPPDFFDGRDPEGMPEIRNWYPKMHKIQKRVIDPETKKPEWKEVEVEGHLALPPDAMVRRIQEIVAGRLFRLRAEGAKNPTLFLEVGRREELAPEAVPQFPREEKQVEGAAVQPPQPSYSHGESASRMYWLQSGEQFQTFISRIGKRKFDPKQDFEGTNFSTHVNVFHAASEADCIEEFKSIQIRPTEPAIQGHFTAWRPPAGYKADGRRLIELLSFFDNAKTPEDKAVILAAILTPGWGGKPEKPYGCRPMFTITANDQGSGKTTLAQVIGDLWGGWLDYHMGDSGASEFLKRILSPAALTSKVVIIDNIRTTLSDAHVEAWITTNYLSGHRMYSGEGQRPNDLIWLATLNAPRLSRDLSERSYFIELDRPKDTGRGEWSKQLALHVARYGPEIIADCIAILKAPAPSIAESLPEPRQAMWAEEVLARACASHVLAAVLPVGAAVDVLSVVKANNRRRDKYDSDKDLAADFWSYVLERCVDRYMSQQDGAIEFPQQVPEQIFVPSQHRGPRTVDGERWGMKDWVQAVTGWDKMSTQRVKQFVMSHHEAGRTPHVRYHYGRIDGQVERGYLVSGKVVAEEIARRKKPAQTNAS